MGTFGRSLAFYLRYMDEMVALYLEKRYDLLKDQPDSESMVRMVLGVGQRAEIEATDFLTACGSAIESALSAVAEVRVSSKEESIELDWQIRLRLQPKGRKGRGKGNVGWRAGVAIQNPKEGPAAFAWLWGPGGRNTERLIRETLKLADRTPTDESWDASTVIVGRVPLPVDPQAADIDRQVLVEKVANAFGAIPHTYYLQLFSQEAT